MTFLQAKKELKKLAKGQYHSVGYELTEYTTGEQKAECRVYIHGFGSCVAPTWRYALEKMQEQVDLNAKKIDKKEMPKGE